MDGPQSASDYQNLISEIIKKQIALLGKDLALTQVRNVQGVSVLDDGTVTAISGEPRDTLQKVIDAYFVFSGMIVKKTMESLLQSYPGMASAVAPEQVVAAATVTAPTPQPTPAQNPTPPPPARPIPPPTTPQAANAPTGAPVTQDPNKPTGT